MTNSSQQRRSLGPSLIGLFLGFLGLRTLVVHRHVLLEMSFLPTLCAVVAALLTGYALLQNRRWWWRPYALFCVIVLGMNAAEEFLDGYGFLAALAYVGLAGSLLLAVGLYLRSAMRRDWSAA
jgi:hypothetical protein